MRIHFIREAENPNNEMGSGYVKSTAEPIIIKSAFKFKNGIRIVIFTSEQGIVTYQADENFNVAGRKPYATSDYWYGHDSAADYHKAVRKMHAPEDFISEHSTELN